MAVRAYLRTPVALAWTLVGAAAVGAVLAVAFIGVEALRATPVVTDPGFLGGMGELLYLVVLLGVLAVLTVVWLPIEAGIAHAVGRRVRGDRVSLRESIRAVRVSTPALGRWLKTRFAVGPVSERVLSEDDVAPNEVAVGCEKFVVPALLLDAPGMLPRAVERANRVTPRPGHERLIAGSLGATGVLAASVILVDIGDPGSLGAVATPLAAAVVVLGGVLTAALSAAWRAGVYAAEDLSEGFSR